MVDEQHDGEPGEEAPLAGAAAAPAAESPPPEAVPAAPGAEDASHALALGPSGFRAPRWPGRGEVFVAYRDITHVAVEPRAVAVGTTHGVVLLSRALLGGERAAHEFAEALRERVFALPRGDERRARFERLDAKLTARRPWIAALLVVATIAVFALQRLVPGFYEAAIYRPPLLLLGDWWRYATTQFLHVNTVHLGVNAVSTLIAGAFVERSLGRAGALFVAGAAGVGAMFASGYGAYSELLGFSGVAAGLFGALLAIEFLAPAEAPAPARVPRAILLGVVGVQALLDLLPSLLPAWAAHTAGLAHLGGFLGGGVAALLVRDSARGLVLAGATASLVAVVASFGVVARNLVEPGPALERQARAMLDSPVVNPGALNNLAWQIATAKRPSKGALAAAAELAETAVALTGSREPTVLDTLAEVYFAQGRADEAVAVIDEAIALAPGEPYYTEQRRRFTGERAAEDRPEAPPETPQPETPRDEEGDYGPGEGPDALPSPGEIDLPPGDEVTV